MKRGGCMAYVAGEKNQVALPHGFQLEGRSRLKLEGVTKVPRFDENTVELTTSLGTLVVHGHDLHLGLLSLDNGKVAIDGTVDALIYQETQDAKSWLRRLFG